MKKADRLKSLLKPTSVDKLMGYAEKHHGHKHENLSIHEVETPRSLARLESIAQKAGH